MRFTDFISGLFLIIAGATLVRYNFKLTNLFGRNNWFEQNLGSGSTYLVFMFVSILVVFVGIFVMFGLGDDLMDFILSPVRSIFSL